MNESGRSIRPRRAFFKVPPEHVLVVHDDVDLELGRLQARLGGGLAGHNGLRSIAAGLGTQDFLRLRVGVGRPERGDPRPVADYVLSPFAAGGRRRGDRRPGGRRGRDARRRGPRRDAAPLQLSGRRLARRRVGPVEPRRRAGARSDTCHVGRRVTRSPLPFQKGTGVPLGACGGNAGVDGAPAREWARRSQYDGRGGPCPPDRMDHACSHSAAGTRPRRLRSPPSSTSSPARALPGVRRALPAGRACRSRSCRSLLAALHEELGRGLARPPARGRGRARRRRGGGLVPGRRARRAPARPRRGARLGARAAAAPRR